MYIEKTQSERNKKGESMPEHHGSVIIDAPVHQVYALFTHFNDFPKFMRFVKEVTYYDDRRSHWVAQIVGRQEWDAINEDWVEDRRIGWRSTNGLENRAAVLFQPLSQDQTSVDVFISYDPLAGKLGDIGEFLGAGSRFEAALQEDLNNFARMVEQAPPGALDPMSSHYLFHGGSAAATGTTTHRQDAAVANDPMMSREALYEREARIKQETEEQREAQRAQESEAQHEAEIKQKATMELEARMKQAVQQENEARKQREVEAQRQAELAREAREQQDATSGTLGGRDASIPAGPLGDRDARTERYPGYEASPMASRHPSKIHDIAAPDKKVESPWQRASQGTPSPEEEEKS
jgi:uncharacterized membrane protein